METKFYSQHGEDFILQKVFNNKKIGFYVDIGALDGTFFSNTYAFELLGWAGICVEAHPFFAKQLEKNRPKAINVPVAIGPKNDSKALFFAAARGSFSTTQEKDIKTLAKKFSNCNPRWKKMHVSMWTLDKLLNKYVPKGTEIDFLTIDIEGGELAALKTINFKVHRPRIIVPEILTSLNKNAVEEMSSFLSGHGYKLARMINQNAFYCLYESDIDVIRSTSVSCDLIRTERPADFFEETDQKWDVK